MQANPAFEKIFDNQSAFCAVSRPTIAPAAPPVSAPQKSTPDRIAQAIVEGIRTRRLAVGQRLVEADLMRELGVGRSTVREALSKLAAHGVVQLIPHRGAVVRRFSEDDAHALLEVLEVLVGLAARLAARHIDEADNRARFEATAQLLLNPRQGDESRALLDERARYYQTLFDIARSPELDAVLPTPRAHLVRSQYHARTSPADIQVMREEYASINEAILRGAAEQAERRMRRHIRKAGSRMLRGVDGLVFDRA